MFPRSVGQELIQMSPDTGPALVCKHRVFGMKLLLPCFSIRRDFFTMTIARYVVPWTARPERHDERLEN